MIVFKPYNFWSAFYQALSRLVIELQKTEAEMDMHCPSLPVWCVSEAGVLVKSYVERGMLVPDHVMTRLMLPRLEQLSSHSWLLDGEKNIIFVFIYFSSCFELYSTDAGEYLSRNLQLLPQLLVVRKSVFHNAVSWPVVETASHPLNLTGPLRCHPQNLKTEIHQFKPSGKNFLHLYIYRKCHM